MYLCLFGLGWALDKQVFNGFGIYFLVIRDPEIDAQMRIID